MKVIEKYKTKSKALFKLDTDGSPFTGSSRYRRGYEDLIGYDEGVNLIIEGEIYYSRTSRGRSSVDFDFKDERGKSWNMKLSAISLLLESIASGKIKTYIRDNKTYLSGRWTLSKQGHEVSIIPYTGELIG